MPPEPARTTARNQEPQQSLSEQAYDRITAMIFAGHFPADSILQERPLAKLLEISRTPVREALTRLDAEGLLTHHAGRGYLLRAVGSREMMEALSVRALLEGDAAYRAAGRMERDRLEQLREAVETLRRVKAPTAEQHWATDDLIHDSIALAGNNRVQASLIRDLRRKTHVFDLNRMPERFAPGCAEHLEIIDALVRRNGGAARRAMQAHIEYVKGSILDRLRSY